MLGASGGLAGATAKTATAPFERVRILNQTGNSVGALQTITAVCRNEGWLALWRSNTVNIVRIFPNKWVLLSCSDLYKGLLEPLGLGTFGLGAGAGALAGATAVRASACARACAACARSSSRRVVAQVSATYPLDVVRTRMAGILLQKGADTPYKTILGTLLLIYKQAHRSICWARPLE